MDNRDLNGYALSVVESLRAIAGELKDISCELYTIRETLAEARISSDGMTRDELEQRLDRLESLALYATNAQEGAQRKENKISETD